MQRLVTGWIAIGLLVGCASVATPTTTSQATPQSTAQSTIAAPSALTQQTTQPTPLQTLAATDCWVVSLGIYRLTVDGASPSATALEQTAQIVRDRLTAAGMAQAEVTISAQDMLQVRLGETDLLDQIRAVIVGSGEIAFVPVPADVSVRDGSQANAQWPSLFGREAIASVGQTTDSIGQPALILTFTPQAATILDNWAATNQGNQIAVVTDGVVVLAPVVKATGFDGKMQLVGGHPRNYGRIFALLTQPSLPGALTETDWVEDVNQPAGAHAC